MKSAISGDICRENGAAQDGQATFRQKDWARSPHRENEIMDEFILYEQLVRYVQSGIYPLHMPGHKRRMAPGPDLPFGWDVTEVPGTDDLHTAEGILADAMERTAAFFGAKRTWYLVNGSTCGLLAAVRALAGHGGEVIMARNCHKAVYHAAQLCDLRVHWLIPPTDRSFGICGSIAPESVERLLRQHGEARCVVITSPTYEGVISDIGAIAAVCHARGVPLLVDEAHGAHLGLARAGGFHRGAVALGADLVVQSAHKTLPSLTQTALLHLSGDLAREEEVARQLGIFETSSPSYPLLASLDGCTGILRSRGETLFAAWGQRLEEFDGAARALRHLRVLCYGGDTAQRHPAFFGHDKSKLLIGCRGTEYTGAELAGALRGRFGFETEMSCGENVLAMTSLCDEAEPLARFARALLTLDAEARPADAPAPTALPTPGESVCGAGEALRALTEEVSASAAAGRVAAEYVWAYPPGVPLVAPGEVITQALLAYVEQLGRQRTPLRHTGAKNGGFLCISG